MSLASVKPYGRPGNLLLPEPGLRRVRPTGSRQSACLFPKRPNEDRRVLACRTCQFRFSERKGSALYRCKLPDDKALSVLQHLQESCGVRQTSRLVGVNKDTVIRLAVVAGRHAQEVHDEVVAFSPSDS